jgi:hypothetical protein
MGTTEYTKINGYDGIPNNMPDRRASKFTSSFFFQKEGSNASGRRSPWASGPASPVTVTGQGFSSPDPTPGQVAILY